MFKGLDTRLYETIVSSSFALAGAILGSYIFGAVYEDTKKPPRSGGGYDAPTRPQPRPRKMDDDMMDNYKGTLNDRI